jgi:hypothetical protein
MRADLECYAELPREDYTVPHPVFFGGATRDYVAISSVAKAKIGDYCQNVTIRYLH